VITAVMLVALIASAALAIDIGSFYQSQRQAQAAADAGALAGADLLAGGTSAAVASASATSIASTNYPSSTAPTVNVSGSSVTVNVASTTPAYFGQIFGVTKENVGARAVAAETPADTSCTVVAGTSNNCDVIFAMDSNCTASHYGISATAGSINLNGGVHSNGSINDGSGGSTWGGPVTNGPAASGCTTVHNTNQETILNGPTAGPVISSWPIDYSQRYPACGPSLSIQCTGPASANGTGTPSYCGYAAPNIPVTSTPTPAIYCAYGTGNPSDPSTYNGVVSFDQGAINVVASYICGSMTTSAGIAGLKAYNYPTNQMLIYAAGHDNGGTAVVNFKNGGYPITGDVFAPNGTINVTAGIGSSTLFFEAQDVLLGAGGYTGDGPQSSTGTGTTSNGSASLTQ
jgi:hypothetical protein